MAIDLFIHNIGDLATVAGPGNGPRRGPALRNAARIAGGALAIANGQIVALGREKSVRRDLVLAAQTPMVDAQGGAVTPGFVDPHTHLVFAGTREQEYAIRVAGGSYEEILAAGGGINQTRSLTQAASEDALIATTLPHLQRMLAHGTTTVEAKSGYGLDVANELKLLRVARRLATAQPIEIVSTFLGAHLVPVEYRHDPAAYVDLIIDKMLPAVVAEGLADYCDVWCDEGIFDRAQSARILTAARAAGLGLRLHANQLGAGEGTRLAVELGAASVDHLERLPPAQIPLLAASDTIAVLVPGVAFASGGPQADARALIDAGAAVALATDFNPGSCYTESMPMIMALACNEMAMTPTEALVAATFNAACSLGRASRVGSLEVGKQADLVLWSVPNIESIPYHFGVNRVDRLFKAGRLVVEGGQPITTPSRQSG
ncbi:MAG: imidazolonepropionase [Anaerolineales bacterium]|nr:imidazolonepropionase [Anaerolineales bacterium]MCB9127755.1 imidazolonepropionase [Ardenticatenales bacterium]